MKRIAFGLIAIATLFGAPALAADMAVKAPPPPPASAATNWAGFYFGGDAGAAWGSSNFGFTAAGTTPHPNPVDLKNTFGGGGFVGIQGQWSNIVLGLEAEWDGFNKLNGDPSCPAVVLNCSQTVRQSWMIGPRAGVAFANNYLLYADGGYARTQTHYEADPTAGGPPFEEATMWHSGWFAGVGLDWMALPNVILGIDYRHIQADGTFATPASPAGVPQPFDAFNESAHIDMVTARASYKFNWPTAAK
jgi:outer membrane immunogenic protein